MFSRWQLKNGARLKSPGVDLELAGWLETISAELLERYLDLWRAYSNSPSSNATALRDARELLMTVVRILAVRSRKPSVVADIPPTESQRAALHDQLIMVFGGRSAGQVDAIVSEMDLVEALESTIQGGRPWANSVAMDMYSEQGRLTFQAIRQVEAALAQVIDVSLRRPEREAGDMEHAAAPSGDSIRSDAVCRHVVILIHGIRTRAEWQPRVAAILERDPRIRVVPTSYGFLDLLRFLVPLRPVRAVPITRITNLVRDEFQRKPDRVSIIAHSFGSYIISQILNRESDIDFHRIILCGSIISNGFDWAKHRNRVGSEGGNDWKIINECGMHDLWPVLAESITWGYGSSGRYGFGHGRVKDRFHSVGHSGFFSEQFVDTYWRPYLSEDRIVPGALDRPTTPIWISGLAVLKLKYLLPIFAIGAYFRFW